MAISKKQTWAKNELAMAKKGANRKLSILWMEENEGQMT